MVEMRLKRRLPAPKFKEKMTVPKYDFQCPSCNKIEKDVYIAATEINDNSDWNKRVCSSCNKIMEVAINMVPQFIIKGWSPDRSRRAVKRFDEDYSIMEEGFTSTAEMQESREIAKEEEKKRDLEAGSLSGARGKSQTPEEAARVKKKAADRAKQARKQRGM